MTAARGASTRLILTQPLPRVAAIAQRLQASGHEVLAFPQQRLESLLDDALRRRLTAWMADGQWLIPVSPFAIEMLRAALAEGAWPDRIAVAFIGPGSLQAWLRSFDGRAPARHVLPAAEPYEGTALLSLPPFAAPAGLRIAVVRSRTRSPPASGASRWILLLRERGAQVEEMALYRSATHVAAPELSDAVLRWCEEAASGRRPVAFVVTSVAAARSLVRWAGALAPAVADLVHATPVWATHPRIVTAMAAGAASQDPAIGANSWRSVRLIEPGESSLFSELESRE